MSDGELRIDSVENFRALGGQRTRSGRRVRHGRVFRSGQLGGLSQPDCARLEKLGLRTVIDFRGPGAGSAARLPRGAELVQLPLQNPARGNGLAELVRRRDVVGLRSVLGGGGAVRLMCESTAALVTDRTEEYGVMLRRLAGEASLPALLHCSAGKDRTGWAASVVLLALDVDEEQVIAHYLESNARLREGIERALEQVGEDLEPELVRPFLEVRAEYLQAAFEALARDFGGVAGYLEKGLGVDAAARERLAEELLE